MTRALLLLILFTPFALKAQDSTSTKKLSHELGFNSVLLVKQLISNNPGSTLDQLPYQLIYTLRFNGTRSGIRAGLGLDQARTETDIQGLVKPRVSKSTELFTRLGYNRDFITHKRIVANWFADAIAETSRTRTETELGGGPFGSTLIDILETEDDGYGLDLGFGVKYKFNEHICIYTEVPLQFKYTTSRETDRQLAVDSGSSTQTDVVITEGSGIFTKIFLPTTVFLNITF